MDDAFLYARVSDEKQERKGLSIPDQVRRMMEYCKRKDIRPREIFREAKSAREENRPEFQKMITEATQGKVPPKYILTWNTSRFSRNVEVAERYKRILRAKGVNVIAVSQEVPDDMYGRFTERMFESIDQLRSEEIGIDTLRGMVENARQGYISGGIPPFGYEFERTIDDKGNPKLKFKVQPDERRLLCLIFQLYVNGSEDTPPLGGQRLADYLNERGSRTRSGALWDKGSILAIIRNPVYSGTYFFNRRSSRDKRAKPKEEWVAVPVPPIEPSLFSQAQKTRKARTGERKPASSSPNPALLTGLLYCGICGGRMTLESAKGGSYPYYNCRNFLRKGKSTCPGQRIPKEIIEEQIKTHLVSKLFTRKRVRAILEKALELLRKEAEREGPLLKSIEAQVRELSRQLSNIVEMVQKWGIDKVRYAEDRAKSLQDKIESLEEKKKALANRFPIPRGLFNEKRISHLQYRIKSAFLEDDPLLARQYLNLLIERIVLRHDKVNIVGKTGGLLRLACEKAENGQSVLTGGGEWLPGQDSNL